jgi:NTE family protein
MVQNAGQKKINLALQGGGAFGAFTWGVLDHILEDERLDIEGVTGASAGAINAIILKDGLARGGRGEARNRLADFWRAASINGNLPDLQRKVIDELFRPAKIWLEVVANFQPGPLPLSVPLVSPVCHLLHINPLQQLIERFVDFDAIRKCELPKLFVSATNVETGKLHIFSKDGITAKAIAASACLPNLFHAVEVEGAAYWDGAFLGNPPIFPLLQATTTRDVLLVQLTPFQRREAPDSNAQILRRLIEVAFNSSLMCELRAIEFVNRLIDGGRLPEGIEPDRYKRVNMHRVMLDAFDMELDLLGPANTDYGFFEMLRDLGREAAQRFLDAHFEDIGIRETMDLANEVRAIGGMETETWPWRPGV